MTEKKRYNLFSMEPTNEVDLSNSRTGKPQRGGETGESRIGVLLIDADSGSQIGLVNFLPSGIFLYQKIEKKLHAFAILKPIDRLLMEWYEEPLFKKYAKLLEKNPRLPDDILEKEAKRCADFLNSLEKPLRLGVGDTKYTVRAQVFNI